MKPFAGILAAIFLVGGAFALADKTSPKAAPGPAKNASCNACREKKPVIDPANLSEEDADSRPAYAAAAQHPETIDKIHCYCGCEESPNLKHASLLTCFTSLHATGCEICRGEAELAGKMKNEGSADDEVKKVVESFYQK